VPSNRLSYLIKVPLALCVVSVVSAIGVFVVTYYLLASHFATESLTRVHQISSTLGTSAKGAIAREDIWDIYQQVRAAVANDPSTEIVIVTEQGDTLVASDPISYPVASSATLLPHSLLALSAEAAAKGYSRRTFALDEASEDVVYGAATSVLSEDENRLATVIVYSRRDATLPKLRDLLWRVLGYGALALAVVIPIGWWLGRRLVKPLNDLRLAMAKINDFDAAPDPRLAAADTGTDEISQLTMQFGSMRAELQRNRELETQMQVAERMAVAGKLASSLAHEVNNPLGGMLNAISNLRLRGTTDPFVEKTANLIERGLLQIQESISALMAQVRREHTLLTAMDFDDLRMLSEPVARRRKVTVSWQVACGDEELHIRSVPVRQVVLNLVLNAINAARSTVRVEATIRDGALRVAVRNDGTPFSATAESAPQADRYGRVGLGLWVCFRLTRQLGGTLTIQPMPDGDGTLAMLSAPLEKTYA
jgi:signal transduction histidine kinase